MKQQYVQHMSGQGEKWALDSPYESSPEVVYVLKKSGHALCLPKSEYTCCAPPDEWEDVTDECGVSQWCGGHPQLVHADQPISDEGYRVSKVRLMQPDGPDAGQMKWAVIVERKKA